MRAAGGAKADLTELDDSTLKHFAQQRHAQAIMHLRAAKSAPPAGRHSDAAVAHDRLRAAITGHRPDYVRVLDALQHVHDVNIADKSFETRGISSVPHNTARHSGLRSVGIPRQRVAIDRGSDNDRPQTADAIFFAGTQRITGRRGMIGDGEGEMERPPPAYTVSNTRASFEGSIALTPNSSVTVWYEDRKHAMKSDAESRRDSSSKAESPQDSSPVATCAAAVATHRAMFPDISDDPPDDRASRARAARRGDAGVDETTPKCLPASGRYASDERSAEIERGNLLLLEKMTRIMCRNSGQAGPRHCVQAARARKNAGDADDDEAADATRVARRKSRQNVFPDVSSPGTANKAIPTHAEVLARRDEQLARLREELVSKDEEIAMLRNSLS